MKHWGSKDVVNNTNGEILSVFSASRKKLADLFPEYLASWNVPSLLNFEFALLGLCRFAECGLLDAVPSWTK